MLSRTANTTFPAPLNMNIKQIRHYDNAHLNLDRVVERAKEGKVIYQDLVEPFLNSEIDDSSVSGFDIVSIISIVISVLAILAVSFMFRKYRKLLAVVTLLQRAGPSTAFPTLPSFIYTEIPTTASHTRYPCAYTQLQFLHTLAFGLLVILYIVFKRERSPSVIIDVTNGTECITCFIMHLPLCIQSCHFHLSLNIKILNVQGIFKPSLNFGWGDLAIFSEKDEFSSLTLPSTVRISIFEAYKIRKSLKRDSLYLPNYGHVIKILVCLLSFASLIVHFKFWTKPKTPTNLKFVFKDFSYYAFKFSISFPNKERSHLASYQGHIHMDHLGKRSSHQLLSGVTISVNAGRRRLQQ